MSSNNASSTVTYTSISFDSKAPSSWGIPLVNSGEIPEIDPYEEVTQQGQAHPLSPAYVPDPMELDDHIADSDTMDEDTDEESIDYPDEPGTESSEDSDETESFEENKTAATPPPPRHR
ncbi:hypothetical protein Tco_0076958 [Tanacetum coccineum]